MRTKEIVGAILALTIFLGLAPFALTDVPGASFQVGGHVYHPNATIVSGADVTVTNLHTNESLSTTTGSNGLYVVALDNMPSEHSAGDIIQVTATHNGMTGTNSAQRSSDSPQTIDVTLEVVADTTAPTIRSVTLDPATVNLSETFTVTVNAIDDASGIASVTANATTGAVELERTAGDEWAGTVTAPSTAGYHTVTVVATDGSENEATDTSKQISVIPPSAEHNVTFNVTAPTLTTDGYNVTINETGHITGEDPLNETVIIELGGGIRLVIDIDVDEGDPKNGTVAGKLYDAPDMVVNESLNWSVDIDLNLNDSVLDPTGVLSIRPLNGLNDTAAGWNGTALGANATANVTIMMDSIGLSGVDVSVVVHASLSGINESDVDSLPINMTVDRAWYRDVADSKLTNVYLFKFDDNGTRKDYVNPESVHYDAANYTYTFCFVMDGFSTYALVGGKSAPSAPSAPSGGGAYPPGWFATPTVTATAASTATPTVTPPEEAVTTPTKPAVEETPAVIAEETPTKKPGIPGFTAVFAIAGLLAVAYVLMRRRE